MKAKRYRRLLFEPNKLSCLNMSGQTVSKDSDSIGKDRSRGLLQRILLPLASLMQICWPWRPPDRPRNRG